MKNVLLFGAGKSATVLIRFLLEQCAANGWQLTVADADAALVQKKLAGHPSGKGLSFNIQDEEQRRAAVATADVVISLLPPALHILVAHDCLAEGKNLLTASYVDEAMESLRAQIEAKGLLFLCEMGLDPGIDHMSAKKLIDTIQAEGGDIEAVYSHCGGLVAPKSDNNPWHYKISWNPRNVVQAGKSGAQLLMEGKEWQLDHRDLFASQRYTSIRGTWYCWYPNRDSLPYRSLYGIPECPNFIRSTLRHPQFITGWSRLIEMGLTSDDDFYETDGLSLRQFFEALYRRNNLSEWQEKLELKFGAVDSINDIITESLLQMKKELLSDVQRLGDQAAKDEGLRQRAQLYKQLVKKAQPGNKPYPFKMTYFMRQLEWLGLYDVQTLINRGRCSAADVLQFMLEKKLAMAPGDSDLVVMCHQMRYRLNGQKMKAVSSLVLEGTDDVHTAMATTVGLPLGIAAVLLLQDQLPLTGLQVPVLPQIYEPVLQGLKEAGITFKESFEPLII